MQQFNKYIGQIFTKYTSTQIANLTPKHGSTVYNTTTNKIMYYDGSEWANVGSGDDGSKIDIYDNTNTYGGGGTSNPDMCIWGGNIFSYANATPSSGNTPTIGGDVYWNQESVLARTLTEKSDPADDDIIMIEDSENSYKKKKVKFSNVGGGGGGAFSSNGSIITESSGTYNDDFVVGSPQLDDDGVTEHNRRMFFDKSKGAFRAGDVNGSQWDDANVGEYSFAEGHDTTASGLSSHAEGRDTIASGHDSHAEGYNTTASGHYSHAEGAHSVTTTQSSHASASGNFENNGDAQYERVVLYGTTETDTPTELLVGGSEHLTPDMGNNIRYTCDVVCGGESTPSVTFTVKGLSRGDTIYWSDTVQEYAHPDLSATNVYIEIGGASPDFYPKIMVVGVEVTPLRWVATVHMTAVAPISK